MKINLRYGQTGLDMELPGERDIRVFRTKDMPVIKDISTHVREALDKPVGCHSLAEIAVGKQDACIVISDITRPVPNRILLPPILETLNRAEIPRERTCLLVATGIHSTPTREELVEMLGVDILARYPVISHDARDPSATVPIGYSSSGIPIELNRKYVESDLKIVTGLVEPHFMAGYSGGRKSVAIGLASVNMVKHLHGTGVLENTWARNCELEKNPLHRELSEIARVAGVDFCLNAVIDAGRRVAGVFAGDITLAHKAACDFSEHYCTIRAEMPADIVVTTGAGYPLDGTYYQAIKGLVGALEVLAPTGGIVLASECSGGLGSNDFRNMLQLLRTLDDYDGFLKHISEPDNFVIDQWEVEMLVKALRRARIYLFSPGIPESDWPLTFTVGVKSMEEGLARAIADGPPDPRIAVIPEGPYVIPRSFMTEGHQAFPVGEKQSGPPRAN